MRGGKVSITGGKVVMHQYGPIVLAPKTGRRIVLRTAAGFEIAVRWLFGAWRNWGYRVYENPADPFRNFR